VHAISCKSWKNAMQTLAVIRGAFSEESMSCTQVFEWKSSNSRPEKARQEYKVKSMLIIFFDIKGIVHKEFVLAGQRVNPAYCCDILQQLHENMPRLCPELW
jgi:hypothetical protein